MTDPAPPPLSGPLVVTGSFGMQKVNVECGLTGEAIASIAIPGNTYRCSLAPDNDTIAVAGQSPSAVYILSIGHQAITKKIEGFAGVPCNVMFSRDGATLVTGDNSGLCTSVSTTLFVTCIRHTDMVLVSRLDQAF